MERNLKITRIYALGNYQNIQFTDELLNIPEHIALDPELINKLRYLQLIGLEAQINKYYVIRQEAGDKSPEELIALLDSQRTDTLKEIHDYLNKKGE